MNKLVLIVLWVLALAAIFASIFIVFYAVDVLPGWWDLVCLPFGLLMGLISGRIIFDLLDLSSKD